MAEQTQPRFDLTRIVLILVLGFVGYKLTEYAPLVPKTIRFMDDVHNLNNQAPEYKKTADELRLTAVEIRDKITALEKRFNWFSQEMQRQRR
jgi:hypothetical protein